MPKGWERREEGRGRAEGGRKARKRKYDGIGEENREEEDGGEEEGNREVKRRRKGREERNRIREEGKDGEPEGDWKVGFWNVAGVKGKDERFWRKVKKWNMVVMVETWVDEKSWESIKGKLPKEFRWEKQVAKRRNRKKRPMGGIMIGIKEEKERVKVIRVEEKGEGVMAVDLRIGGEGWRMVGVYANGDIERKMEILGEWLEGQEEDKWTLIGGDFNARTGLQGGGKGGDRHACNVRRTVGRSREELRLAG